MRKIAPDTDTAQMISEAKVVAFAGAMRAKPANKIIIQSSSTAKKGSGIELPRCEKRRNLACIRSTQLHNLLGIRTEMAFWQRSLQDAAQQYADQCQTKCEQGDGDRSHVSYLQLTRQGNHGSDRNPAALRRFPLNAYAAPFRSR
jgi:hypothetical protein